MTKEMHILFLIAIALFVMQSIGAIFQIKAYRKAISRVHKYGNVGLGQKRGFLFSGYLIIIACDNEGIITYAEIMDGASIFARFHEVKTYLGRPMKGTSIYDYLADIAMIENDKKRKRHKGYYQALDALSMRLNPDTYHGEDPEEEETEELEAGEENGASAE